MTTRTVREGIERAIADAFRGRFFYLPHDPEVQVATNAVLALLAPTIAALVDELQNQWEYNHGEHCGIRPADHAPNPVYGCNWPMPEVLRAHLIVNSAPHHNTTRGTP